EEMAITVAVKVLHGHLLDPRAGKPVFVSELLVDDGAALDVPKLRPEKGIAAGILPLLELEHDPEPAFPLDGHAVAEVAGVNHSGKRFYREFANRNRISARAAGFHLGEDGVAKLLGPRNGAQDFRTLAPGRFQLDVTKSPGPTPYPLEGGQILNSINRDGAGKLGQDPLIEDDPLVGQDIFVGAPAPVIEVDDPKPRERDPQRQEQLQLSGHRDEDQDHPADQHRQYGGRNRAKQHDPMPGRAGQNPLPRQQVAGVHGAWLSRM